VEATSDLNKQYHAVREIVFDWGEARLQAQAAAFLSWLRDACGRVLENANVRMHDAAFEMPGLSSRFDATWARLKFATGEHEKSDLDKQYHIVRGFVFDWGKLWLQTEAAAFLRWLRNACGRVLDDAQTDL
jgi:hypothetical protein